jgi:hypothetical protein
MRLAAQEVVAWRRKKVTVRLRPSLDNSYLSYKLKIVIFIAFL